MVAKVASNVWGYERGDSCPLDSYSLAGGQSAHAFTRAIMATRLVIR